MALSSPKSSSDPIDLQGLAIIGDRQHIAGKIGQHKVQHDIPVYDAQREAQLLEYFRRSAEEKGIIGESAGEVLERLFLASREVQQRIFETLAGQNVAHAMNGEEEFARLRQSMSEMNVRLLNYMAARAQMIAAGKKDGIFTREQWTVIAKISPYDLDPVLAGDLYDLLSKVTLKSL